MRMFEVEQVHYREALPMYAYKTDALRTHLDAMHQSMVLTGGTGIGKTVGMPQYVLDHLYSQVPVNTTHVGVREERRRTEPVGAGRAKRPASSWCSCRASRSQSAWRAA